MAKKKTDVRGKLLAIEQEQNAAFLERGEVTRGLLVGLLARQHVLLLGPPGTAKSAQAEDLCSRIGGTYFRWLLARTSTPEELFGPVSLQALEQDSYRRVTAGKLPEAHIAFLDEVWKCNSAVLNSLLSVLNERLFFNDGQPAQVPLQMLVGASNELPEDREELGALWDRFLLRYVVGYLKDPRSFEALLTTTNGQGQQTTITAEELAQAQAEAAAIPLAKAPAILGQLRTKLQQELQITVSDRRWKQSLDLVKANAYLNGSTEVSEDDLGILAAVLWQEPSQIPQVKQLLLHLVNPIDQEALDLSDEALEVYNTAIQAADDKKTTAGAEANKKLRRIHKRLGELQAECQQKGRSDTKISEMMIKVKAWNEEVVRECLGIDL